MGAIRNTGLIIAKGAIAAGVLDVLENIGMLPLHGYLNDAVALLTFSFSITKWLLALSALIYFFIAGGTFFIRKIINRQTANP